MSVWSSQLLGDIAVSVDYGVTASASPEPVGPKFLRITDIQEGQVEWDSVPFCQCGDRAAREAELRAGDIVFARTGATTGKSFLIRECPDKSVFASYLIRVRLGDRALPCYIAQFFQSHDYWAQITKSARGAAQPGVNATTLRALEIPLPPLPEQQRIAAILDKADELRAKRRATLAELDTLVQSIFLEMFGDPATNPKKIPTDVLGGVCKRVTDGTHQPPQWSTTGHPFLFVSNIVSGEITYETEKFISDETHASLTRRCPIEAGDVLYSTVGSYGVPALVRESRKFAFQRHIAHLKPDQKIIDSAFLCAMMGSPPLRQQADRAARGVAQKTLNLAEIKKFVVFRPSLDVQGTFSSRAAAVEKLKAAHRASLAELDTLFASLQHRAFRGDL